MSTFILSDDLALLATPEKQLELFTVRASKHFNAVKPEIWLDRCQSINKIITEPFITSLIPIDTICLKCGYGIENVWHIRPKDLYNNKRCPGCFAIRRSKNKPIRRSLAQYDQQALENGVKFLEPPKNVSTKTKTQCLKCNHIWSSRPFSIFNDGHGCPNCGGTLPYTKESANLKLKKFEFELQVEPVNNVNGKYPIRCSCGVTSVRNLKNALAGTRCNKCSAGGYDAEKPGYLYYLRIAIDRYSCVYKIGITNLSLKKRWRLERFKHKITVIDCVGSEDGYKIQALEQHILEQYSGFKYNGKSPLEGVTNSEMFLADIMQTQNMQKIFYNLGSVMHRPGFSSVR